MSGVDWQNCFDQAQKELGGVKAIGEEVATLATQLIMKSRATRQVEHTKLAFETAVFNANEVLCIASVTRNALHGLLQSMVIQAWSAFEILAEDLWQRVNAKRPELRAAITGKEWNTCGFKSRSRIANAYKLTFRVDNNDIARVVDNTALHALAIARNVLVHSGGRIDAMFIRDRKNIPELKRIKGRKEGYLIVFTGDLVRYLIDPLPSLGFGLVKAVDQWLILH